MNKRLYVCGGDVEIKGEKEPTSDFFSIDCEGISSLLQPISQSRSCPSLNGLPSELIAIGGWNGDNLTACEKYIVNSNKWIELPSLNTARQWPGSILLSSKKAFCFCGSLAPNYYLNSVETVQTDNEVQWRTLPLNDKITKTYHLAAADYMNKLVLFGGASQASYHTLTLSKEGELEQDLPKDPLIPGVMCSGSFWVLNGKIYAVGSQQLKYRQWRMKVFNGKKWSLT